MDSEETLKEAIDRYNEAWNAHDLDAIMAMHAPDMVFDNHTAGESASGEEDAPTSARSSRPGPTSSSPPGASTSARASSSRNGPRPPPTRRRCAAATSSPSRPAAGSSGTASTSIPFEDGLVKRKDVYSDSVSILRQVGLID